MTKSFVCLISLMVVSGCGTWPGYGTGGMDEVYSYERSENLELSLYSEDQRLVRIANELDAIHQKITLGWKSDAGKYRPYNLTLIEIQWGRVAREFAGHFHQDAEASLNQLRIMVLKLEAELKSIQPKKTIASARGN